MQILTNSLIPVNSMSQIANIYQKSNDYEQEFVQILAIFFNTLFKKHLSQFELFATAATPQNQQMQVQLSNMIICAHNYMLEISKIPNEIEIFKICLDYWCWLAQTLFFHEKQQTTTQIPAASQQSFGLMLSPAQNPTVVAPAQQASSRLQFYSKILSDLRVIFITRMAKPEEVIIVEDENGQIVKEYYKDVDSIQLYKTMKEGLIYLTNLDFADTENIMIERLHKQIVEAQNSLVSAANAPGPKKQKGNEEAKINWGNLNCLCWAIGSVSGSMDEKNEKQFLITVLRDLLNFCDDIKGKDNKAVIASNIMYVVGQYPR